MVEGKVTSIPVKPILNMEQAKELFAKEHTIFADPGGVPLSRAAELFGEDAIEFVFKLGGSKVLGSKYNGLFGIGAYQCLYLTWEGFLKAVTYVNIVQLALLEAAQ